MVEILNAKEICHPTPCMTVFENSMGPGILMYFIPLIMILLFKKLIICQALLSSLYIKLFNPHDNPRRWVLHKPILQVRKQRTKRLNRLPKVTSEKDGIGPGLI